MTAIRPTNLAEHALSRIALWSGPRHRLHDRFVSPWLAIQRDAGAHDDIRCRSLDEALRRIPSPSCMLLGAPGAGKTTALKHFDLETSLAFVRGRTDRLTFFVELHTCRGASDPWSWLRARWSARNPDLPDLAALMAQGRVTLLLDGLNELAGPDAVAVYAHTLAWKQFIHGTLHDHPGCRAVITCRGHAYSTTMSTPAEPLPQIAIEPLDDAQIAAWLDLAAPARGPDLLRDIRAAGELDLVRRPFLLACWLQGSRAGDGAPRGRSALLAAMVRSGIRREVERDNALFEPGRLLTAHDRACLINDRSWRSIHDLPSEGLLVDRLASLAEAILARGPGASALPRRVALDMLGAEVGPAVLQAGIDIGVLDAEPNGNGTAVSFVHQLLVDFFAARRLAVSPDPERARTAWRADAVHPSAEALIRAHLPEPLPPLPPSPWEDAVLMAAEMCADPDAFVRGLVDADAVLAGRCTDLPEVRARVSQAVIDAVRRALVERCAEPLADIRSRVAAGLTLGRLGDPRLDIHHGPLGRYRLPALIRIAGATYPVSFAVDDAWTPPTRGLVDLAAFRLGKFPVTNAEWADFMAAGGYDDPRWWDTHAARAWHTGHGTADGARRNSRYWREVFHRDPGELERFATEGVLSPEVAERWRQWVRLGDAAFERAICAQFPGGRMTEPLHWRSARFNNPSQPVVGVSWSEARAYCNWLAAQTGRPFRLPTLAEAIAATGGLAGRPYAWGRDLQPLKCQMAATRIPYPAPVGAFPDGNTPEGLCDMTGTVDEWVSTAYGPRTNACTFRPPYDPDDGREDADPPEDLLRMHRGGGFVSPPEHVSAVNIQYDDPNWRSRYTGFRLCVSDP